MTDEIKQPRNIGSVQPSNPSRNAGQRKRPRQDSGKRDAERRRQPPIDDQPHQVDEYV